MTTKTASLSLLEAFFSCCERGFRFMEIEHNFSYISGLLEHKNGRRVIKPPAILSDQPTQNQQAITLYENGAANLDISYLPTQGMVNITISQDGLQRVELLQLLNAAQRSFNDAVHARPLKCEGTLDEFLSQAATLVRDNIDCILEPTPALLQRAIAAQEKLREQKIRVRFRADLDEASQYAARAFLKKDYKRVIEVLLPYEAHLGSGDLNKLVIAKKEILKG